MSQDEIFRRMFGKDRPPVTAGRYVVVIDGMNAGEARIDPAGDGSIEGTFLKSVVVPLLLPEAASRLASFAARPSASFVELRSLGYSLEFDAGQLVLVIGIPMSSRTTRVLPLNPRKAGTAVSYVEQADVSAYVSVRGGFDMVEASSSGTGLSGFGSDVDLGLNVSGIVGQARIRFDESARRRFSRTDVRLTYDDVSSLMRYELGDLSVNRRPYQVGPRIAGIAAYREYRIDPYLNFRASGERGFELETSSKVEVVVNGAPVRTFSLPAGRYSLRDLPLVSSATNDVQIRVTGASGRQETISFPAFAGIDLLDPGRDEFAINAGVPYRDRDGVRRYDDGDFNVMGFYRRGLSQTLTVGATVEANRDLALIGGEVAWASPFGTIDVNAAVDVRNPGLSSSRLALRYLWREADQATGLGIDAELVLTGEDYRTLDQLLGGPVSPVYFRARLAKAVSTDLSLQIGGSYERVRDPDSGERWALGASLLKQFGPVSAGASLDYERDSGRASAVGRLSLFVPLGRGAFSSTYSSRDNAMRAEYNQITAAGVGSFGYNVGAERRDGADRQFARASYVANRFEAAIDQSRTSSGGRSDVRTGVSFGTALVMADGAFAVSRPISNSFAIVSNSSGVKTPLAIEPRAGLGSTDVRYSAFTDFLGPGVVPDIPAYYERPIEVAAPGAPAGSGLGGDVFNLRPGFRSGYRLRVGTGTGSVSALGFLTSSDGTPLALASGEVRRTDGDADAPPVQVFTNGAGRFFVEGLVPKGRYDLSITVGGKVARSVIEVPADAQGIWSLADPIRLDVEAPRAKD